MYREKYRLKYESGEDYIKKEDRREFRPETPPNNPAENDRLQDAYDLLDRKVDLAREALDKARKTGKNITEAEKNFDYLMDALTEVRSGNAHVVNIWAEEAQEERRAQKEKEQEAQEQES